MAKPYCADLDEIKEQYKQLEQKYKLPSFNSLAEDFDIEKTAEKESSFLLRDIRRAITEKISAYLHLFETLINPSSAPSFIFNMLKNADEKDKEDFKEIYKKLAKIQLSIMKLDTIYNEEKEAEFIINSSNVWQELKNQILEIIEKLDKDFDLSSNITRRGYFG